MIKNKKDISLIIGMLIIFIGALLPSIKIANENISFFQENGPITTILVIIMVILFILEKKQSIFIPSIMSISIIIKFIIENTSKLKQLNELYNYYASYQYGLIVMIIGNLVILYFGIMGVIENKITMMYNLHILYTIF